jgi:hypothetical protein
VRSAALAGVPELIARLGELALAQPMNTDDATKQ